jgi:uncharacterized protein (DUF2062 family)
MNRAQWRARLAALLQLDDSPWRIALALAIGVFISFTPFWFFQTLLALLIATIFRLNRGVAVTGVWLNLPWFAPFIYAGAVKLGEAMPWFTPFVYAGALKVGALLPGLSSLTGFYEWVLVSTHLLVGTTTLGLAAAAVTWLVTFGLIRARRHRRRATSTADASRHAA